MPQTLRFAVWPGRKTAAVPAPRRRSAVGSHGGGRCTGAICPCHRGAGRRGMGVGAKMAKGAVVRSRSLRRFYSSHPSGCAGWGRRLLLLPSRCPTWCSENCCFPAVSHSGWRLDRAAGLWARTWRGEGGSGLCEPVSLWGGGRGKGSVAGVRCQANNLVYSSLRPLRG